MSKAVTEKIILRCLRRLLRSPDLDIPIRQRAKFEGWLKVRLAHVLEAHEGLTVELEAGYAARPSSSRRHYADLLLKTADDSCGWIMLKTCNTNFRFPGVRNITRPITQNIREICADVHKLRGRTSGYVGFTMFPIAAGEEKRASQVRKYLDRIEKAGCEWIGSGFVRRSNEHGVGYYLAACVSNPLRRS